jgi:flagellar protein FliO/FliZ
MITLLLRLVISMAVVMAVMALAARLVRRRQGTVAGPRNVTGRGGRGNTANGIGAMFGRAKSRQARPEPLVDVVFRRPLAKGAWVTLVEACGKRFLVGVTEQSVTLLAELPPVGAPLDEPGAALAGHSGQDIRIDDDWLKTGRMPASLEGATTDGRSDNAWKLALDSLRERTVRR